MALVVMFFMHRWFPVFQYVHEPLAYTGIILVILGIGMAWVSAAMFRRAGTGIEPFDAATTLVTGGFYRYSRNPMYLGMFLMLAGNAIMLGSAGAALPLMVFVIIIRNNFVLGEERFLESVFGQRYLDYKSSVRRWL